MVLVEGNIQLPKCANLVVWFESVAQLVEHRPFKALVLGSSPSALTITSYKIRRLHHFPNGRDQEIVSALQERSSSGEAGGNWLQDDCVREREIKLLEFRVQSR